MAIRKEQNGRRSNYEKSDPSYRKYHQSIDDSQQLVSSNTTVEIKSTEKNIERSNQGN